MIKKDTIEYRLVSLIGLAGEIKTDELYKLNYGKEYIRKTICRLNSNGFIKVYQYLGRKYLRLTSKCKKYLSSNFPERFSDCFVGATSTNKIRNDDYRRERYHRLGEVLVMLNLAGVKIFAYEKSLMKKTHGFKRADGTDVSDYSVDKNTAEFYTSTELKASGFFMNARTSRAIGVIYSYPDVYIIYNFADEVLKMEYKTEDTFYYRAGHVFLGDLNEDYYRYAKCIFVGRNMELMEKILTTKSGAVCKILNGHNDYIAFLDNSKFAPQQLKYFINDKLRKKIRNAIYDRFGGEHEMKYTGLTKDWKTNIMDCTDCNITGIKLIKKLDVDKGENVKIVCFHFQWPYIQKYFGNGDNVEYFQLNATTILETEEL